MSNSRMSTFFNVESTLHIERVSNV